MACENSTMATYVFLDSETTGLPGIGESPRIVEISMVAVQCKVLSEKNLSLPRVLDKLVISLNPCNKPMSHGAAMITGLYNDQLEELSVFNEDTVKLLNLFISRLPTPVCMLAHNGDRFDFPMLKMELEKINQSMPADLYCADTLRGLRFVELGYSDYGYPKPSGVLQKPQSCDNDSNNNSEITPVKNLDVTPSGLNSTCAPNNSPPPAPRKKRCLSGTRKVGVVKSARRKLLQDGRFNICDSNDGDARLNPPFPLTPSSITALHTGLPPKRLNFENRISDNVGDSKNNYQNAENQLAAQSGKNEPTQLDNNAELLPFPAELFEDDFDETETSCSAKCQDSLSKLTGSNWSTNKTKHADEFTDSLPDADLVAVVEKFSDKSCQGANGDKLLVQTEAAAVSQKNPGGAKGENHVDILTWSPNQIPSTKTYVGQLTPTKQRATDNSQQSGSSEKEANHQADEMTASRALISTNQMLYFSSGENSSDFSPRRTSFKLPDIYKRYFGNLPEVSHSAEDDCVTLLKIVQACVSEFASWVEQNAKPFSEIKKMY